MDWQLIIPTLQARAVRDVHWRYRFYKAVDWMFFILSTGEVVLHNRFQEDAYGMFMFLWAASRLLFLPYGRSEADVSAVDSELKSSCLKFYSIIYCGSWERTPVCRSTIAALLDIVPNLKACGPAWVYWHFPMEGYIGALPKLFKLQSKPYKSLAFAMARTCKSELVKSFAELHAPDDLIEATGHRRTDTSAPKGEYSLSNEEASCWSLLPPRDKPAFLEGAELQQLTIVLNLMGCNPVPEAVYAKKYFPLTLENGAIAGSRRASSDADRGRCPSNLVRVLSTARRRGPS